MSSEPVEPLQPKEEKEQKEQKGKKGFVRKLPQGVVKLLPKEAMVAQMQPIPSGQLETMVQSFQGITPPPTSKKEEEKIKPSLANPLLHPPIIPKKMKIPADTGPSLPKAPIAKKKPLRYVQDTMDFKKRVRAVDAPLQGYIDNHPTLKGYQTSQKAIETNNPYETDTQIYTPQSRRSFYRFINDNYEDAFKLLPQVKGRIDTEACSKLGAAAGVAVEAFLYQKFIREYIRNASPYRGILVYHGLGSGKTCSAIAAAEALYGTSNKKIIVMTPYSLRGNFMSEISFCGFRHFHTNNHWVAEPIGQVGSMMYLYGESVMSLSENYLNKVLRRPEEERRVIWIPDFSKEPNYESLSQQEREDIRAQITNVIETRITFISYNGVTANKLKEYACQVDPQTGERLFDNAVIVIDEIHNLTRLMQGEITPYITERKGKQRKIPAEPIVPGKWTPGLCNKPLNYKRSYLFYKLLTDARNSKIIGLSGTPIINFPDEVAILANVLAGYTECAEFILQSPNKDWIKKVKDIAEAEPRIDIVRFKPEQQQYRVLLSVFQEGYERVEAKEEESEEIGVQYRAEAQEGIHEVFGRIKQKLQAEGVPMSSETYVSYPRLPVDPDEFKREFINSVNLSIENKLVLQKRLTGLISYYKGSKEEYMPRIIRDDVIRCEMSDYTLSKYVEERIGEIEGEAGKEKETGDVYASVEMFAKMKNPSSYRFRSRALCNFAFPKAIERPFPGSMEEEIEEVVEMEDLPMTEVETISEEDIAAQEIVAQEEEKIEAPEVPAEEGEQDKEDAISRERVEEAILQKEVDAYAAAEAEVEEEKGQEGGAGEEGANPIPPKFKIKIAPKKPVVEAVAIAEEAAPAAVESAAAVAPIAPRKPKASLFVKKSVPVAPKEEKEVEEEAEAKPSIARVLSYQEKLQRALRQLDDNKDKYLKLDAVNEEGALRNYSSKLDRMLRNIQVSKGSNLVYSQFKTVEGLGVLGIALRANGYVEIKIEGGDAAPYFSKETESSLRKGPQSQEKRFISFTGEGSRDRRNLVLNIFNGNFDKLPNNMRMVLEESGYGEKKNQYGDICWVIGITGAGAEGISLKCCRSVHIMEPYWNNVRLDQVKGRAVRICSHQDLPFEKREVEIYTYYSVFSADQKNNNKIDMSIRTNDNNETSDEKVYNVSMKKDKINQEILTLMKEAAVDCGLNSADNEGVQCFMVDGRPDQYLFDPDLQVDKLITSSEFVEMKRAKEEAMEPQQVVEKEVGQRAPFRDDIIQVQAIKYKGVEYLLRPKSGLGGLVFEMFAFKDDKFKNPLGEITINPLTGTFKGSKPVMKA
jgi:hypothetical protein